jgi:3'(2'), 5'-bisphosphate nucleotidase
MNYPSLLDTAKQAALAAGEEIMAIYNSADFEIEQKADDSPLTKADKNAHLAIVKILEATKLPVLSEEGRAIPFNERQHWTTFWMIDPLDGTKEFIKRNGEFTVNIALIENNQPTLGLVYSPVLDKLYWGGSSVGFSKLNSGNSEVQLSQKATLSLADLKSKEVCRIVASRSHRNQETEDFIASCNNTDIVSMGSSLKFMILAEGNADIYPRYAPTMEWDTAAAHAILLGIGYDIYQVNSDNKVSPNPLQYNKKNLLNPSFICF